MYLKPLFLQVYLGPFLPRSYMSICVTYFIEKHAQTISTGKKNAHLKGHRNEAPLKITDKNNR